MKQYNVEEFMGRTIIWYEEDNIRYSFGQDSANPDYQAYLDWLENPQAEQSTPMVTDEASTL
jgi:hypothetical protein